MAAKSSTPLRRREARPSSGSPRSRLPAAQRRGGQVAAVRPRTSLGDVGQMLRVRHVDGGGGALSRVASFMEAGRASLNPEALSTLSSARSKSAQGGSRSTPAETTHVASAWMSSAPRKHVSSARKRLQARPVSSLENPVDSDPFVTLPPRPSSVMLPETRSFVVREKLPKQVRGRVLAVEPRTMEELERYTEYMEDCATAIEDRLHVHVPLRLQDALITSKARSTSSFDAEPRRHSSSLAASSKDILPADPTASVGNFDESAFDRNLALYLADVRKQAMLPPMVTKLQRWWRMKSQRRKFQRFKAATRVFRQRTYLQIVKGWNFVALAESWMRGTILSNNLAAWRMLARNAANWSEESALIFVECMRKECALQQAVFLECNDKRIFRRAGMDYNWGRGWKFGRPLPTRQHVIVVQALRHKILWSAKMRVRRWKSYIMWISYMRGRASKKMQNVVEDRMQQMFILKFAMWRRWSVVMRCEKSNASLPDFQPRLLIWDDWHKKHLISRMQDDKRQLDDGEVHSLKWRFLCRIMWVAWNEFLGLLKEERQNEIKIKAFSRRKIQENALGGWLDLHKKNKAIRHRDLYVFHSLRDYVAMRGRHKRAEAIVSDKWHRRSLKQILSSIRRIATYMLIINAGGLNRIRHNKAKCKWALFAWLSYGVPIAGPECQPGGLCSLGVCGGHFHLVDSWKLWSSKACRRLRMKKLMLSCFYEENVFGAIMPAFIRWQEILKAAGKLKGAVSALPKGKEKVSSYKKWIKRVKSKDLTVYCDIWSVWPRIVTLKVQSNQRRLEKSAQTEQLEVMGIQERMDLRKSQYEQELGVSTKNPAAQFPALRGFLTSDKVGQIARAENNLAALKRDFKLLLVGELRDAVSGYASVYDRDYAPAQGKKAIPFKSKYISDLLAREQPYPDLEQVWFPESPVVVDGKSVSGNAVRGNYDDRVSSPTFSSMRAESAKTASSVASSTFPFAQLTFAEGKSPQSGDTGAAGDADQLESDLFKIGPAVVGDGISAVNASLGGKRTYAPPEKSFVILSAQSPDGVQSTPSVAMQKQESVPSGLKWLEVGNELPAGAQELKNAKLARALTSKSEFTKQELDGFGIANLQAEHYVKSGDSFFKPALPNLESEGVGSAKKGVRDGALSNAMAFDLPDETETDDLDAPLSMWDYEDSAQNKDPKKSLQDQVAATLKVALDDMYDKMVTRGGQDILPRRERVEPVRDPYFDKAYPERQKLLKENYVRIRENELGPKNTHRLLELESLQVDASEVTFEDQAFDAAGQGTFGVVDLPNTSPTGEKLRPPKTSKSIEDSIISASFHGTFHGIDVAMDLGELTTASKKTDLGNSEDKRPRRKNRDADELYSEAIQSYRARASGETGNTTNLGTILESPPVQRYGSSSGVAKISMPQTEAAESEKASMSRPSSSCRAAVIGREDNQEYNSRVVTRIPTMQMSHAHPSEFFGSVSINDSIDTQSGLAPRPSSSSSVRSSAHAIMASNLISSSPPGQGPSPMRSPFSRVGSYAMSHADAEDEVDEAQSSRPSTSTSIPIAVDIVSRAASVNDNEDSCSQTSSSLHSRLGTTQIEEERNRDPWDAMLAENGWITQEAQGIAEAMRGDLDSLYWRSQVISKRSKRQRAVQMAIEKDFALSKALQEARTSSMNQELYVSEINAMANLNVPILPAKKHVLGQKAGKLERGFTNRSAKRVSTLNESLSDADHHLGLHRAQSPDKSISMHDSRQVLQLQDADERDFLKIAGSTGKNACMVFDDETQCALMPMENLESGTKSNLDPSRSLTDLMLTSTHIQIPSSSAKSVQRFNEDVKLSPRKVSRPSSVLMSIPIDEGSRHNDHWGTARSGGSGGYTSLEFPTSDSQHVAGGARVLRNVLLSGGSATARKHIGVGKLSVALERPNTERSDRSTGEFVLNGNHMKTRHVAQSSVFRKISDTPSANVISKVARSKTCAATIDSFVHEFGRKPSAHEHASIQVGGSRVGTVQARSSSGRRIPEIPGVVQRVPVTEQDELVTSQVDDFISKTDADIPCEDHEEFGECPDQVDQSKRSTPVEYEAIAPSTISYEQARCPSRVETLWQPWGRMDVHDILSELFNDVPPGLNLQSDQWDTVGAEDILEMHDAFGPDGQVDLSGQLRPPKQARCGTPISLTTTEGSSRPSSSRVQTPIAGSRLPSPLASRPSSSMQAPARTQEVAVSGGSGYGSDLTPDANDDSYLDSALPEQENVQAVTMKKRNVPAKLASAVPRKRRNWHSSSESVAAASQIRKDSAAKGSWSGVAKEVTSDKAAAAAGPYLTVKSVAIATTATVRLSKSARKGKPSLTAGLVSSIEPADLSSPLASSIESSAKKQIPANFVAKRTRGESNAEMVLDPLTVVEFGQNAAQTVTLPVSDIEGSKKQRDASNDSCRATESALQPIDNFAGTPYVSIAEETTSDGNARPESPNHEESAMTISESHVERENSLPLAKEVSEQDLMRAQEILELSAPNSPSAGVKKQDQSIDDAIRLTEFQKYVTKLSDSDDKIDHFKEGRKLKIKEDAAPQFSPKSKSKRVSLLPKVDQTDEPSHEMVQNGDGAAEGIGIHDDTRQEEDVNTDFGYSDAISQIVSDAEPSGSQTQSGQGTDLPQEDAQFKNIGDFLAAKDGDANGILADGRDGSLVILDPVSNPAADVENPEEGRGIDRNDGERLDGGSNNDKARFDRRSTEDNISADSPDQNSILVSPFPAFSTAQASAESEVPLGSVEPRGERQFAVKGFITRKKPASKKRFEIDLFRKHRDQKFAKQLQEGVDAVVPEWKKFASVRQVPSARRVVLSSSSEDESNDEDRDFPHTGRPASAAGPTSKSREDEPISPPNDDDDERQALDDEKQSLTMEIARRQYDALYGKEQRSSGPSWRQNKTASLNKMSLDDEAGDEGALVSVSHWTQDRRLVQAHNADHFYEALRLRQAARRYVSQGDSWMVHERGEDQDEEREILLLGNTASLPDGVYNENLARIQNRKRALQGWEEDRRQKEEAMREEQEKKRQEKEKEEQAEAEAMQVQANRLERERKEKEEEARLLAAL